ncbi:MAG: hypothetical protein WC378_11450 [Opitutaceae bacterium]|jgi:hypothetical protein
MTSLTPELRRRALLQGTVGEAGAFLWFFAIAYLGQIIDAEGTFTHALWHRILFGCFGLLGLTGAMLGLWRLSLARDKRLDPLGIGALLLMGPGLVLLFMWLFYAILAFHPGSIMGG